jgi:hypothetical protein
MLMTKDIRMWNGQYLRAFYSSRCKSCAIGKPCDNVANDTVFHLTTPLFYVNKKLSSEARGNLTLFKNLTHRQMLTEYYSCPHCW